MDPTAMVHNIPITTALVWRRGNEGALLLTSPNIPANTAEIITLVADGHNYVFNFDEKMVYSVSTS